MKGILDQIRAKGVAYWITVLLLIALGTTLGEHLNESDLWLEAHYKTYQLLRKLSPQRARSTRTMVVLIGDKEYWKGELARRIPIKRNYLAKLLRDLSAHDPGVIALDFDMRSPAPDLGDNQDYTEETREFIAAIREASLKTVVVLPATVKFDGSDQYVTERAIYDGYSFNENVRRGYISLPFDVRQVPLKLSVNGGKSLNSFAGEIVRALDPKALPEVTPDSELPYGTFIGNREFCRLASEDVLSGKPLSCMLRHNAVVVSGAWSKNAYGRGDKIDTYLTPIGYTNGVFVHANYVEALLGSRTYRPISKPASITIEVIFSLLIAICLAMKLRPMTKLGLVLCSCLIVIALSYVAIQNLGVFFDFFFPVVLLLLHSALEKVREWRADALECIRLKNGELLHERR